jgi:hypothetical protein
LPLPNFIFIVSRVEVSKNQVSFQSNEGGRAVTSVVRL